MAKIRPTVGNRVNIGGEDIKITEGIGASICRAGFMLLVAMSTTLT